MSDPAVHSRARAVAILVALNLGSSPTDLAVAGVRGNVLLACRAGRESERIEGRIGPGPADGLVIDLAPDSQVPVGTSADG
jgi:hypothetical protein